MRGGEADFSSRVVVEKTAISGRYLFLRHSLSSLSASSVSISAYVFLTLASTILLLCTSFMSTLDSAVSLPSICLLPISQQVLLTQQVLDVLYASL